MKRPGFEMGLSWGLCCNQTSCLPGTRWRMSSKTDYAVFSRNVTLIYSNRMELQISYDSSLETSLEIRQHIPSSLFSYILVFLPI